MRSLFKLSLLILVLGFAGCAAKQLRPGAEKIIVGNNVPKNCKFKGQVMGEQGGALTGGWTSNKNLAMGAMNEMRNEALALGANYVQLLTRSTGNTMSGSDYGFGGGQTDVTQQGNAYLCPPSSLGTGQ
ncbi:MAG: DUF4156 domain-containing protein [Bdellovibrionota bacterium]